MVDSVLTSQLRLKSLDFKGEVFWARLPRFPHIDIVVTQVTKLNR